MSERCECFTTRIIGAVRAEPLDAEQCDESFAEADRLIALTKTELTVQDYLISVPGKG